jgi:hypothetical protein
VLEASLLALAFTLATGCHAARPGHEPAQEQDAASREAAAMVSARENWTDVRARVLGLVPTDRKGFVALEVELEELRAVEGFVSLPAESAGRKVVLLLRTATQDRLAPVPGDTLAARVRRGRDPHTLFADERTVRRVDPEHPPP